jgi:hypothetical protein
MLRDPEQKVTGWENPPYTSFTSGYRLPEYASDGKKDDYNSIYALKAFPMSPNSNEISMQVVRNYVLKARDLVIEELLAEAQVKPEDLEGTVDGRPLVRTPDNWFGENEHIPLEYLIPPESVSIEETLKNIPFCAHLTDHQLRELTQECKTITMEAGSIVCSEGEQADNVYVILSGKVKVYKEDEQGNETTIATLDEGNMFGEMALFDKGIRSASVKTIEPCRVLIFEGNKFLELLLG